MTVGRQEKIKWYQSFYFLVGPIFLLSAEKRTNKFKKPPLGSPVNRWGFTPVLWKYCQILFYNSNRLLQGVRLRLPTLELPSSWPNHFFSPLCQRQVAFFKHITVTFQKRKQRIKDWNIAGCPRRPINPIIRLIVLYLSYICPIFGWRRNFPYRPYYLWKCNINPGVLSYNFFQTHVQPAFRQVKAKMFTAAPHIHVFPLHVLYSSLSLDVLGWQNVWHYAEIPASTIVHKIYYNFLNKRMYASPSY